MGDHTVLSSWFQAEEGTLAIFYIMRKLRPNVTQLIWLRQAVEFLNCLLLYWNKMVRHILLNISLKWAELRH